MTRIFANLCLFLAVSCNTGSKKISLVYKTYQFDKEVIQKLPIYDSLANTILKNYPSLQKYIGAEESYRAYRYMALSDSADLFKKIPAEETVKINSYFAQLGKNFIYGFDLFKDSSIKIYIRQNLPAKEEVETRENLSYYPPEEI